MYEAIISSLWFTCNRCCSSIWFLPRFPEPDILMAMKELLGSCTLTGVSSSFMVVRTCSSISTWARVCSRASGSRASVSINTCRSIC